MAIGTGILVAASAASLALLAFVTVTAGGIGYGAGAGVGANPSEAAVEDVPSLLLRLFIAEAQQCQGLPWTVMAGISRVESNHGRVRGSQVDPDGVARPSIIGIPLDRTSGARRHFRASGEVLSLVRGLEGRRKARNV